MSDAARISFAAIDRENPWPGLASFTEDSREFFFGREKETEELSRLVRRQTLTVLFGQSGLGKSSLLHAGLFPLLRETDHLPLYLRLDHAPSTPAPAEQVKSALTAAFAAAKADAPAFRADETLWEYFHRKDVDIWSAKNRLLTPVLAFDQFEEVFTLGRADEASRERSRVFLAELACLVENRAPAAVQERMDRGELDPARFNFTKPSCQVILSLREDFLPDLESLKQSMPALVHNRLRLKKLSGTQALEIVTKPAPHLLAEGVAEKIVEFVAGARGGSAERLAELDVEPPLLSVICRELNDRRRALGQEKITADLVSGNRREILTDFYERSVADLPAPMRTFVEDHLLTKSGFRDNLALETALEFPGVARPLIDTLVSRRLLRVEDRLGVQRVELTHDVLAEVIRAARDARQQRLALEEAREKERHALAAAARAARRQRWVIAGLGAAVVLLLVGAFFGIRAQRRSAAQASQTDLVLGSRLLDEGKVAEGLAYLVRAGYKDRSNRLVGPRLLSALSGNSFMLPTAEPLRLPSPAVNAGFLSDGRRLLFRSADRILRQIDVESWQVAPNFSVPDETGRVVRTAEKNADVFAMAGDGQIFICDGATGQSRIPPIDVPGQISGGGRRRSLNMVLSPDGHWVAAAGPGEMWIWDATSGALIATLPSNSEFTPFAFSPDSRGLAIGRDRVVSIWSIVDRAFASASVPSAADIYFIGFSGDGRRLFAVNYDGTLVADAGSGTLVRPLIPFISNNATFATVQLSRDGNLLLYATSSRTVTVIDVATGRPAYAPLQLSSNLERFDQVAEGKTLFAVSLDGTARLWDLATGNLLSESTLHRPRQPPAVVSPDGRTIVLFTATGEAYRLRPGGPPAAPLALPRERATTHFINMIPELPARLSWVTPTARLAIDIATGRETVGTINFPEPITDAGRGGYGFTFGPGDTFAVRTGTGELRFWTLGEKEVARNVPLADPPSGNIILQGWAIDSDVHRLAYRLGASNKLGIWDSQTGRRIVVIEPEEPVSQSRFGTSVAFSPDGKYVAVRTGGRLLQNVIVFEVSTGKSQFVLRGSENAGLATCRYSPDGRRILTGDNWGGIQVWNAATGALIRSTQHHRSTVVKFEFSPDRHFYASVSNEGSVQVWDAVTDQPVGELLEQSGGATRAEFSPDSTRIATPSASSQARIWDVQTGLPVTGPLSNEGDPTTITVFSLDGKFVDVHGGATNVKQLVRVWAVPPSGVGHTPDWLLTFATICAGQRLTDQGKFVSAIDELEKIDAVQRTLAAAPADDAFAEWGRWLLSTDANRPIAPGFAITPAEAAKVRDNFLASLTAAPATKP